MRGGSREHCNLSDIENHCCCKDYGDCFNYDDAWHKMFQPGCPACGYWCECMDEDEECLCYPCNKIDYENVMCEFCKQYGSDRKKSPILTMSDLPQEVIDGFVKKLQER